MMEKIEERISTLEKTVKRISVAVQLFGPGIVIISLFFAIGAGSSFKKSFDVASTHHYNNGTIVAKPVKMIHVSVIPTTGNGGVLDISSYGLTQVLNVIVTTQRNTSVAGDVINASIKSFTNSQVVYNIVQANPATVTILGLNVLSGNPQAFPSTTSDITLRFIIVGY